MMMRLLIAGFILEDISLRNKFTQICTNENEKGLRSVTLKSARDKAHVAIIYLRPPSHKNNFLGHFLQFTGSVFMTRNAGCFHKLHKISKRVSCFNVDAIEEKNPLKVVMEGHRCIKCCWLWLSGRSRFHFKSSQI